MINVDPLGYTDWQKLQVLKSIQVGPYDPALRMADPYRFYLPETALSRAADTKMTTSHVGLSASFVNFSRFNVKR
jgi:hypothetical protein